MKARGTGQKKSFFGCVRTCVCVCVSVETVRGVRRAERDFWQKNVFSRIHFSHRCQKSRNRDPCVSIYVLFFQLFFFFYSVKRNEKFIRWKCQIAVRFCDSVKRKTLRVYRILSFIIENIIKSTKKLPEVEMREWKCRDIDIFLQFTV